MAPPGLVLTPEGWFSWCRGLLKLFQNKLSCVSNEVTVVCAVVVPKGCAIMNVVISMRVSFCHQVIGGKIIWVSHAGNSVGRCFPMLGNQLLMK